MLFQSAKSADEWTALCGAGFRRTDIPVRPRAPLAHADGQECPSYGYARARLRGGFWAAGELGFVQRADQIAEGPEGVVVLVEGALGVAVVRVIAVAVKLRLSEQVGCAAGEQLERAGFD